MKGRATALSRVSEDTTTVVVRVQCSLGRLILDLSKQLFKLDQARLHSMYFAQVPIPLSDTAQPSPQQRSAASSSIVSVTSTTSAATSSTVDCCYNANQ